MNATVSPAIPLVVTILGYGLFALWIAALVIAVTTLMRARRLSTRTRVLWCLAMIVIPLLGAITWLIYYGVNRNTLRPIGMT